MRSSKPGDLRTPAHRDLPPVVPWITVAFADVAAVTAVHHGFLEETMTTLPDPVVTADTAPLPKRFTRKRSAGAIITILVLVEIISAFETSMVFAAIPTIIRDFNSDAGTVGWAVTAFLLVAAAAAAVCGRIGDMYGRERVLIVLLAAATVGSLVSALGDSIGAIIVGRAIQGVAGAILPLCIGLAREHLP